MSVSRLEKRAAFSGKIGFVMACIGSAVGMGNIWRFPIMVAIFGGMNFILPYLICVYIVAVSGVTGEFALGRAAQAGTIKAFIYCCTANNNARDGKRKDAIIKRIAVIAGALPVLGSLALAIGYTVVMSWICRYTYLALSGHLLQIKATITATTALFQETAANNTIWIVAAIALSLLISALGVGKGIERANRIMMPLLFFLFLLLAVYVACLPAARSGYAYIFNLQADKMTDPVLWLFAFGQAFFSLSVAGNGSVIYGSYLPKNEDLPQAALHVALFDTLAALLAALVIIPAMAAGGAPLNQGGPGLLFVWLVQVLQGLPYAYFLQTVFFGGILLAGLSSLINLYESPVAVLQEEWKWRRIPATCAVLLCGGLAAQLINPITARWMDIVSIYICPLGAFLAAYMFFWRGGMNLVLSEVNQGSKRPLGKCFFYFGKYIYCFLCLLALTAGAYFGGIG